MCGICGVMTLEGPLDPVLRQGVRAMNGAIAHRGPDGDGFFDDEAVALGHRRLAIIDRAGGAQPIGNEDFTCWIIFNGEVYNHRRLRPLLEARGHRFRTASDTETILHAWEEYGTACVDHLEGMFAFAVYDSRRRELFLARDRVGKKPLFYSVSGGVLQFASELAALRAGPAWSGEIDLAALEGYLSLGYFLAPHTAYRGVSKLEPGSWLRIANGRIETRRYWDVAEFSTDTRPEAAQLDDVEQTLRAAVHDRLESEVPLGAFLSGGIDSGLVVSFMAEALAGRLVTATVGFAETAHNELDAARVTASAFRTQHHEEVVAPRLDEVFDEIVTRFGEPMADSSAIPTWYVSRSARAHVTVALSGDGGDETFGGYDFRYVPHVREEQVRRLVAGAPGRRLARWMAAQWPRSRALPRPLRLGGVLENLSRDPASAYYLDLCFLKPHETARLLGRRDPGDVSESPVYAAVTDPYRRCPSPHALQRAQYADLHVYMPNDPLVKVDRMSMAHSLEVRSPMLDRRVVELAFRLPATRHVRGATGKVLLRSLAARRLPPALALLPKRGFTVPIGEWIAGPYRRVFADEVLGSGSRVASLVDRAVVRQMLDAIGPNTPREAFALWAVWLLERWLRTHTGRESGPPTVTPQHQQVEPPAAAARVPL